MHAILLRSSAAMAVLTVSLLWEACTPYAKPTPEGAGSTYLSNVVLQIRVVEDSTSAPVEDAWVGAFPDSGEAPAAQGRSSSAGQLQLHVPRDGVELRVRRLGYHPQQRRLPSAERGVDTIPTEFRLLPAVIRLNLDSLNAARARELRMPTAVTPCRPRDGTASQVARGLRLMIVTDAVADEGMVDLRLASVEQVVDRVRCRAAIKAIGRHEKRSGDGMQVYLFQIGYQGWAAHEPATPGYGANVYILDWNLIGVRRVVSLH